MFRAFFTLAAQSPSVVKEPEWIAAMYAHRSNAKTAALHAGGSQNPGSPLFARQAQHPTDLVARQIGIIARLDPELWQCPIIGEGQLLFEDLAHFGAVSPRRALQAQPA